MTPIWFQHRYKRKDYPMSSKEREKIDLTLTDDEYRLVVYAFRMGDRVHSWIVHNSWELVAEGLEARKLMFRYTSNSGETMWSLSNYGCDAFRARPASEEKIHY